MLIHQESRSDAGERQGSRLVSLSDLREQLARPSQMHDGHRRRLIDLAGRMARLAALMDEHARVDLSEHARAALAHVAGGG